MSPRKRRCDQAFSDEAIEAGPVLIEGPTISSEKQRAEKEQEVWEAIREAHFEAIEQLPLTLQRQLSLMRQLDEQTVDWSVRLLPTLQDYIKQRRTLAGVSEHTALVEQAPVVRKTQDGLSPLYNEGSSSSPATGIHGSVPLELSQPPETRDLLSNVAWMAEELLRASQEKFNISQANLDSVTKLHQYERQKSLISDFQVERHIWLLEQAIKEQEASLSEGTSLVSLETGAILPELAIPDWPEKFRNAAPMGIGDGLDMDDGEQSTSVPKGKMEGKEDGGKNSTSLVITISPQTIEELYCYCNRISFGVMIGCDSESCEREWFHLGCVGLTKPPGGKWFCEDCRTDEML